MKIPFIGMLFLCAVSCTNVKTGSELQEQAYTVDSTIVLKEDLTIADGPLQVLSIQPLDVKKWKVVLDTTFLGATKTQNFGDQFDCKVKHRRKRLHSVNCISDLIPLDGARHVLSVKRAEFGGYEARMETTILNRETAEPHTTSDVLGLKMELVEK